MSSKNETRLFLRSREILVGLGLQASFTCGVVNLSLLSFQLSEDQRSRNALTALNDVMPLVQNRRNHDRLSETRRQGNAGGWPSTTGYPSGGGRSNNLPSLEQEWCVTVDRTDAWTKI